MSYVKNTNLEVGREKIKEQKQCKKECLSFNSLCYCVFQVFYREQNYSYNQKKYITYIYKYITV